MEKSFLFLKYSHIFSKGKEMKQLSFDFAQVDSYIIAVEN